MTEFFKYACSDLWVFCGCTILLSVILHYTINGLVSSWSRLLRCVMVLGRGWPPSHLDADGDFKETEDNS